MAKTRILIVMDSLQCGGAERSLVTLLRQMDAACHDVDLVLAGRGGDFERYVPEWVNIIDLDKGTHTLWGRMRHLACRAATALSLRLHPGDSMGQRTVRHWRIMKSCLHLPDRHYDIAIAYQQGLPTFLVAEKADADRRYAWINVDLNPNWTGTGIERFYSRMDRVAVVSDRLKDIIADFMPTVADKLTVRYDPVDSEFIRLQAGEFDVERHQSLTLTTVARLSPPKDVALAVRTAAVLRDRGVSFSWYIVGDGPLFGEISDLVTSMGLRDHVVLTGKQVNPYPYMAACDVYVQTSLFEGFGLTITEALILGKPVVTTDFQVVREQITDGVNGLITAHNPVALADAIQNIGHLPDAN